MKVSKVIIIPAVILAVLASVVLTFAQYVWISLGITALYNQHQAATENEIERFASDEIREYIYIPDRLPAEDDVYEAYGIDMQVFNRFILTDEEAETMKTLVKSDVWHSASEMTFKDEQAENYWDDIMHCADFEVEYTPETTYYLIFNHSDAFITTEDITAAFHYEIVIFDAADNSYYYINFSM